MRTSDNGIKFIKYVEGVRYKPYRDIAGLWTVGVGHLIEGGKQLPDAYNKTFTTAEIDELLRKDLLRFEIGLSRLLPKLSFQQHEYDALISFVFNVGLGTLQRSTLRQSLLRGDKAQAAKAFMKYVYAGGKVIPGLINRRKLEQKLFLGL